MIYNQKILIAEDDLASAEYLKLILEESGYKIASIVDTGLEAIEEYKKIRPDLVLMDVMLKDKISGCEAALKIKHLYNDAKIIFLTAYFSDEIIQYAVESEAFGYLIKPYREGEIIATLKLALSYKYGEKKVPNSDIIELDNGYSYHIQLKRLFKENKEVSLGKKALKLMEILVKNKNSSVSNEQICSFIWGENRSDCTIRSLIHRIRIVVGSETIKNINGRGYEIITKN